MALAGGLLHGWLLWRLPGSDSDFAGLCCFAESVARGVNPTNPYFPPGYPLLLWAGVKAGLSCFAVAALLNGAGLALAMYHAAALWRRFGIAPLGAGLAAVLLLLLPDMIWLYQAPHTDGLMLGLAAVWLHGAVAAWRGELSRGLALGAIAAAVLLVLCRWHAVLVVVPVLIVLVLAPRNAVRRFALAAGIPVVLALLLSYGLLYTATGSAQTAARLQVFTGLNLAAADAYTATKRMTADYGAFAEEHRGLSVIATAGWPRIIEHTAANFGKYLTRKATLAGLVLFLLAGVLWRAWPRGAVWLAVFTIGYALAISPSYFVHRASCLLEWCGVVLAGAALAGLLPRLKHPGWRWLGIGAALVVLGYGAMIASRAYRPAVAQRQSPVIATLRTLVHDGSELASFNEYSWCLENPPFNLPAPSLNRLWLDDPQLNRLTVHYPRYTVAQLVSGRTPTRVVLLKLSEPWVEVTQVSQWTRATGWRPVPAPDGYEIWLRPD